MNQPAHKAADTLFQPASIETIVDVNTMFKFRAATFEELQTGITLAESLMGTGIADLETVWKVHQHTTVTAWVLGDPIEAIHLMVPLTVAGAKAVRECKFEPGNPDLAYCAAPGEDCGGVYVGVYAGTTREARRSIMQGAAFIRMQAFGTVPCFARAATDDGARSMKSLGFNPVDNSPGALWVQEALVDAKEQAA